MSKTIELDRNFCIKCGTEDAENEFIDTIGIFKMCDACIQEDLKDAYKGDFSELDDLKEN